MEQIDNILNFAEKIAKEDNAKMLKYNKWNDFIEPLFNAKFDYKYDSSITHLYNKECKKWLDNKRNEFNSRTDNQIPDGFTTMLKDELPGRAGSQRNENVCNWCDARKLCQENKDGWCQEYTCMSYARSDGRGVVFKRL